MNIPELLQQIMRMTGGYCTSQVLYVAAKLGIADLLKEGPKTAEELASSTQTHPRSLYRLLSSSVSLGLFAQDAQNRFSLTPLGEWLRSDVPGSQRATAVTVGDLLYRAWGELLYSVQTGRPAFEKVHRLPFFEYLSKNPEQASVFDEAMAMHGWETTAILEAYDFSGIPVLADIGGGNGSAIIAILKRYPQMRGILFDLPGVIERAKEKIEAAGVADRCQVVGGSFLDAVSTGADAYLMRHVIHDWDDEKATQILKNIHRAMAKSGKLLIGEYVIPPGNTPSIARGSDLVMLVIAGGQERTEDEFRALFERAAFRLTRIVPTKAGVCVIEGLRI
jgi:ubiquinone/menaquinone biosynthesis C-methylase UbiE